MPTERCRHVVEQIRAADVMGGVFDGIYGKLSTLFATLLASAPWWVDHLSEVAQVAALVGGGILWALNAYLGYLKIRKLRAEIDHIEDEE